MAWACHLEAESWFPYLHLGLKALFLPPSCGWWGVEAGAVLVRDVICRWSCAPPHHNQHQIGWFLLHAKKGFTTKPRNLGLILIVALIPFVYEVKLSSEST